VTSIATALNWIEQVLLGSVATATAVIAVAALGFMMMGGRVDFKRAAEVVLGCFVLFSAATVARDLLNTVSSNPEELVTAEPPAAALRPVPEVPPQDPYAGAALPQ
jgi:hypothetical protein